MRLRRIAAALTAGLFAFCAAPSAMAAQQSKPSSPYPSNDSPLTLPSGTVVHQRNLVVFRGHHVSGLTIVIETPTPAADSQRIAREAHEVATLHAAFAEAQAIDRITVAICRSQACIELREVATEMFQFVRAADGTWVADHSKAP